MQHDEAGRLLLRLLAQADLRFDPPAFVPEIAESVLGPSGQTLTPHRRLLEARNGFYTHGHALHFFGATDAPAWHSLRAWNAPGTWRDEYLDTQGDAAAGLVFFAEDAFGDQFAYRGDGGEVVIFESELGRIVPAAGSFLAFIESVLAAPGALLPLEVVEREAAEGRPHVPGTHLFAYPPLFSVESREGVTIGHVDAVEAMRFRGQLARQVRGMPTGARVRIELEGLSGSSE